MGMDPFRVPRGGRRQQGFEMELLDHQDQGLDYACSRHHFKLPSVQSCLQKINHLRHCLGRRNSQSQQAHFCESWERAVVCHRKGQHRRPDHCRISLQDARRQPLFLDVDIAGFLSLTCSPRARRRPCTAPPCSALFSATKTEFRSQRKIPLRQPRPPATRHHAPLSAAHLDEAHASLRAKTQRADVRKADVVRLAPGQGRAHMVGLGTEG